MLCALLNAFKNILTILLSKRTPSFSFTIDCVEAELMGVSSFHSKRVAVVSIETGRLLGFDRYMLMDLAAVALLHDNIPKAYLKITFCRVYTTKWEVQPVRMDFQTRPITTNNN